MRARWADEVYAALPKRPKVLGFMDSHGYGLLVVENGKCKMVKKAKQQPWVREKQRKYRFRVLGKIKPAMPHEVAGLPAGKELAMNRRKAEEKE